MRVGPTVPESEWTNSVGNKKERDMLSTLAVILLLLWVLGMITSYTMSGFIHILLVVALVVFLVRVIQGRRLSV